MIKKRCLTLLLMGMAIHCHALVFPLPTGKDALIGQDSAVAVTEEDTLVDIARRNDLGFDEIVNANPVVDNWLPREGTLVTLPHRALLPAAERDGIVVNVAEMRLYYFPPTVAGENPVVESFPISIGRSDWSTPLVTTTVARKMTNPEWHPPQAIREEHAAEGDPLPEVVGSGPDNPLGLYALYLGVPSYLIHGTNKEFGIGMQVTHGCMRMYPEDIEHLYQVVPVGSKVAIVNQPYKIGWSNGVLYAEVHPWLEGSTPAQMHDRSQLILLVQAAISDVPYYPVDWNALEVSRLEANGQPTAIGPQMAMFEEIEFEDIENDTLEE